MMKNYPTWIETENPRKASGHLVTADERGVGERLFEFERARYLSWCGAVIGNAGDAAVLQWVYREKGEASDLITAFHLSGNSQRRNMRRRYEEREP